MDVNDQKGPQRDTQAACIDGRGADVAEMVQKNLDRSDLIAISSAAIAKVHGRIQGQRFRAKQDDPILLSFVRAEAQMLTTHNTLIRDAEMDEIKQRLDALEARKV